MLQRIGIQVGRALGFHQIAAELLINLSEVIRRGGGHFGNPVFCGIAVDFEDILHKRFLELQAVGKGLRYLHREETSSNRLGQFKRCFGGQVFCAIRALRACRSIDPHEIIQALGASMLVSTGLGEL